MSIETDLNVSPFYDDFDTTKNFHRILFRPSVPIQARELTQLQSILQNQIERFGDNIFVEGTIIQGCNFIYDTRYDYVKLPDLRNDGQPTQPSQYLGLIAYDATSNLQAVVVNSVDGYESQNPDLKTIYLKYTNSGSSNKQAYTPGTVLTFYSGSATNDAGVANATNYQTNLDVKVAPSTINGVNANPVGVGYSFSVNEGIIFQKGNFIRVANNISTIVSKYSPYPNNVSVGFSTTENIVTELQDTSLLDNSQGSTNLNAPGAYRLQLIPTLTVANTDALPSNNFFSLVQWENGNIIRVNQQTQYNAIGNEMARREYEASGNFVVKSFNVASEVNPANTSYFNLVIGSGLGYVHGQRVEQLSTTRSSIRKGTDTKTVTSQSIATNYGNYIRVQELAGVFSIGASVNLYDTATTALTLGNNSTISPSGSIIGKATVLSFAYESGTTDTPTAIYDLYLTNIIMNSGKVFTSVKAVASTTGVADLVLEKNVTLNANTAMLKSPTYSTTIFPTGKSFVKTLYPNNDVTTSFTYRQSNNSLVLNANGVTNALQLTGSLTFPYGTGTLNGLQELAIIAIPSSNITCNVATGTVGISSTTVTGSGTTFLSQYQINDYIVSNANIRRITNIANNISMTIDRAATVTAGNAHAKSYPANIPINFSDRNSTISLSNTSTMKLTLINNSGVVEGNLSMSNSNLTIYYDTTSSNTAKIVKTSNQSRYVAIDTALYANLAGTITCSTGSTTVTGTSTFFAANILPGYNLYIANSTANSAYIGTVASVASDTSLTLTGFPTNNYTTNTISYSANASSGPAGPWSLGFPDVYKLRSVYKISSSNTWASSSGYDVTSQFAIQTNQTDTTYNISQLIIKPNANILINNGDKLTVVFDVFTIPSTTVGFFSVDSYPIDDANTANTNAIQTVDIPYYKNTSGNTVSLKDSIDFRAYVANTIPLSGTATTTTMLSYVNPLGNNNFSTTAFVSPNQLFSYDVQYYLGRKSKVTVSDTGRFSVIDGIPAESPTEPADQTTAMTIGVINIPPYPTLLPSEVAARPYSGYNPVSITINQTRRYTMKDIDKLNKRLTSVEYYSSLSLLETATKDLSIKNSVTGLERFKNGIFVDNFDDDAGTNTNEGGTGSDPDETSKKPYALSFFMHFKYDTDANSGNDKIKKTGDVVHISHTEVPHISNQHSTKLRKLSEVSYNFWNAHIKPVPDYLTYIDSRFNPIVNKAVGSPVTVGDRWEGIGSNVIVAPNTSPVTLPIVTVSNTQVVLTRSETGVISMPPINIKIDMFPGFDNPSSGFTIGPLVYQGPSGNVSVDTILNSIALNLNNSSPVLKTDINNKQVSTTPAVVAASGVSRSFGRKYEP